MQDLTVEKNQWNAEIKSWVGKRIGILLTTDTMVSGALRWVDRYTMCIWGNVPGSDRPRTIIVHKGAIAIMYQEDEIQPMTATP